jgi:hypothetical protein
LLIRRLLLRDEIVCERETADAFRNQSRGNKKSSANQRSAINQQSTNPINNQQSAINNLKVSVP